MKEVGEGRLAGSGPRLRRGRGVRRSAEEGVCARGSERPVLLVVTQTNTHNKRSDTHNILNNVHFCILYIYQIVHKSTGILSLPQTQVSRSSRSIICVR